MDSQTQRYETWGSVRGSCGHRHVSIAAAEECRRRDATACAKYGGYSDRLIRHADGERLTPAERDTLLEMLHRTT